MQFEKLTRWAGRLDDTLRLRDFAAGRTAGGFLDRTFGIRRHTIWALLLPSATCFFAVLATPNLHRFVWAIATATIVFLVLAKDMAASSKNNKSLRRDLYLQLAAVSLVVIPIWAVGDSQYAERLPYANLLLPLTLAVALALFVAGLLSDGLFRKLRGKSNFGRSLCRTELFANRGPVLPITGGGLLTALFVVPFRSPLELLLFPAIAALLAPPELLTVIVLLVFAVSLVALVLSGLNERFGTMWSLISYAFLHDGGLLVSLLVIALAAARFAGVSYVTTVFDTAAGWVVSTVLISTYVLAWWFGYWMNRLLADQLIRIIEPDCSSGEVSIPYRVAEDAVATHVPAAGRILQLHGSSRFMAIREREKDGDVTYFQSYPALDLINALALAGAPGGRAIPTFLQLKSRAFTFQSLTTAVLAAVLIGAGLFIHGGVQDAQLATDLATTGGIVPAALLAKPADDHTLFVVAASGGGTRAALFTAAVLEGIASRGKMANVVLGSGVSGGGAALAYLAGFRQSLIDYDHAAWGKYYEAMKAPYIRDVLERASEWRMLREGRLGMLLQESFVRRWGLPASASVLDSCASQQSAPGCSFGLILNTTLAGHLHLPEKVPAGKTLAEVEPKHRNETSSSMAGGRLILTNLSLPSGFAGTGVEPDDPRLPIVVRGPAAHLEHAAALNANFPPVFANAAIDTDRQDRYWATDGGAADNRGMEMLLYSLRGALDHVAADQLPRLHIIVADAGAYGDDYVQDRGVSSALGGGAHFASALDSQLKSSIEQLYVKHPDRFAFSYVYMPRPLRASGSFGTHWMLQDRITVHQKHERTTLKDWLLSFIGKEANPQTTISGEDMINVLRSLYNRAPLSFENGSSPKPVELSSKARKVLLWAREENSAEQSRVEWRKVMAALGDTDPDTAPLCH
jgi:hypothetical protein